MQPQPNNDNTAEALPNYEAELAKFAAAERKSLGLDQEVDQEQWQDNINQDFFADQVEHTTILVSGLTMAHDNFVQAGLAGLGYKIKALDCPDNEALQYGKEFGNRGPCNPTYFTVGNLVINFKYTAPSKLYWAERPGMRVVQALHWLRDVIEQSDKRELTDIKKKLRAYLNENGELKDELLAARQNLINNFKHLRTEFDART